MSQYIKTSPKQTHRLNTAITAPEIRLIGENGEMIGIVSISEAINQAKTLNLDLVEISPDAKPPVCKIMNYGKFLYTQSKQQRLHKAKQKKIELKTLRLSFKIEAHDLENKLTQAKKFLEYGHKVKLDMKLRGREKAFTTQAMEKMNTIINSLDSNFIKLDQPPKATPQGITVILAKK